MSEQAFSAAGIASLDDDADLDVAQRLQRRRVLRRAALVMLVVLLALGLGAGRSVFVRMADARALEAGAASQSIPFVKTAFPKAGAGGQALALPGTLQGFVQAPVSARASGYLRRWTRDIGSRVEKGELLGEIDTPEIDQQLTQALAARDQTSASLELAASTVERWEALRRRDVVSQQELDERRNAVTQARANLAAAEANVQRLRQLEGFKRVVAPFAGVITRRNVDTGDLIDAGAARPLFLLSQTDPLRIYVNVPQSSAHLIRPGQPVIVTQAELRGQRFEGKVARTAASIDVASRTMQIEVTLANPKGVLLPGAYVQVSLPLVQTSVLVVSTNALLFRGEGVRVAVVDPTGRVGLRPVALGRNFGENVEVLDGVAVTDRLVLNPPDSLVEGDRVALAPAGDPGKVPPSGGKAK